MSLFERIEKEYITAYKAKDSVRLGVLRLLKTAVKNKLVELKRPGGSLSDPEMLDVIIKEGKQRQDAIEQYNAANRPDLAEKEAAEFAILQEYLPKALSPEELAQIIEATISEVGASSPRDMGRVISAIMAAHKGQVDGKALSEAVKQRLAQPVA
ncbi:MAG: GatB/YqeY domain-containing protein [Desulfovibrionaceae bacterium]|nr:GatB/YqeY domain-containing protein [Desulfovibrionaceae bacterium]